MSWSETEEEMRRETEGRETHGERLERRDGGKMRSGEKVRKTELREIDRAGRRGRDIKERWTKRPRGGRELECDRDREKAKGVKHALMRVRKTKRDRGRV